MSPETRKITAETKKITALSRLMEVGQELALSTDLDELLAKIMRASLEITTSRRASILLVDDSTGDLYFRHQLGKHGEILQKFRVPLNDKSIAGWCLKHREPVIIDDVSKDPRHYKRVDEATHDATTNMLAVPIIWGERDFGVIEVLDKADGMYAKSDSEYLTILAAQAAVALNNVYLVEQLQNFFVHTVELLIAALETVDPDAKGHTERVARMATALARELGVSGKDREQVLYGAYFHDIGRLLNRTAKSDLRDPVVGAQLLERIKMLEKVAPIVRSHRERFDGSGYPDGLKGAEIPLGARILGLAVDYDEQFTKNSQVLPPKVFQEWYFEQARNRHDPQLLDLFRKVVFPRDDGVRAN